jgi:hypothetical protein
VFGVQAQVVNYSGPMRSAPRRSPWSIYDHKVLTCPPANSKVERTYVCDISIRVLLRERSQPDEVDRFTLDRTVDVTIRLNISQNDNGYNVVLVLRTPNGGPEAVEQSLLSTDTGAAKVTFPAVPAGFYSIVIQSADGTVAGTFIASWDNASGDVSAESDPISVTEDQFGEIDQIPDDLDIPEVSMVPDSDNQQI